MAETTSNVREGNERLSIHIRSEVMDMVRLEKMKTRKSYKAILEERLSQSYRDEPQLLTEPA